jgi:hypothetical protein
MSAHGCRASAILEKDRQLQANGGACIIVDDLSSSFTKEADAFAAMPKEREEFGDKGPH